MDHTYTSNEFLFSFKGRINRAKYWYAAFASGISCLFFVCTGARSRRHVRCRLQSVYVSIDIFEIFKIRRLSLAASFSNPPASAAFSLLFDLPDSDHGRRHLVLYG